MYYLGLDIVEQQITIGVDADLDQVAFLDAADQDLGIPRDAVTLHVNAPVSFD